MEKLDILKKLHNNQIHLTKSQRIISEYLLKHYQEVAMMSAVEFGEKVNVSDATISRFVRSIGFESFYEFKNHLREGIKNFDSPYKRVVNLSDKVDIASENAVTKEMIMEIGEMDIYNVRKLMANLDLSLLEQAVETIFHAKTIYLIGIGSSAAITDFLSMHLRRMGFKVIAVTDGSGYSPEKMISMTEDDLLIATTFPRYSKGTYDAIIYAKKMMATVLTIMDSEFPAISEYSDIVIPLKIDNVTFFNSLVVPMVLGNWLVMMLLNKDRERILKNVRKNTTNTILLNLKI